jgi:protein TonB
MREIPPEDEKPKRNWLGMGSKPPSRPASSPKPDPKPKPKPKPEPKPKHSAERERRQLRLAQNVRSHVPASSGKKKDSEIYFWVFVLIGVFGVWYVFFI